MKVRVREKGEFGVVNMGLATDTGTQRVPKTAAYYISPIEIGLL